MKPKGKVSIVRYTVYIYSSMVVPKQSISNQEEESRIKKKKSNQEIFNSQMILTFSTQNRQYSSFFNFVYMHSLFRMC